MKNILFFLAILTVTTVSECDKVQSDGTVIGKWKLTETLADPGDGSGKWRKAESDQTIIFNSDGTITPSDIHNYKSYVVKDKQVVEFTLTNGNKISATYTIDGTELTLRPPCIEACGSKYKKVK